MSNTNSDNIIDTEVNYNGNDDSVSFNHAPIVAVDELMSKLEGIGMTQRNLATSLVWSFAGRFCSTWAQLQTYANPPSWLEARLDGYKDWISYFSRFIPDGGQFSVSPIEMVQLFGEGEAPAFETDIAVLKHHAEAFGITIEQAKKAMALSHQELAARQKDQMAFIKDNQDYLVKQIRHAMNAQTSLDEANVYDVLSILMKALDKLPVYQDRLFTRSMRTRNPVRMRSMQAEHKLLGEVMDWADEQYIQLEDWAEQNPPVADGGIH